MKLLPLLWTLTMLLTSSCKKENIKPNLNFTSTSYGCSNFIVYKVNKNEDAAIAVIGNREKLNLSTTEQTFNLTSVNPDELKVEIRRYKGNAGKYYCNDVPSEAGDLISIWNSKNGNVTIKIVQDSVGTNAVGKPLYIIDVKINNIEFENNNGRNISIDELKFENVNVGWLPG